MIVTILLVIDTYSTKVSSASKFSVVESDRTWETTEAVLCMDIGLDIVIKRE